MKPDVMTGLRVLTTKKVLALANPDNNLVRADSVSTPTAQTTTKCEVTQDLTRIQSAIKEARLQISKESKELYFIVVLQFENALRISEVLNISCRDIDNTGNVYIKGSKGSNPKIIPGGEAREFLLKCKANNVNPFSTFDRFFIYRLYKKYNLVLQMPNRSKSAVTHSARHLAAIAARESNFEEKALSLHLSHKSKNSTKHYGK